jgi:hypothetical protein
MKRFEVAEFEINHEKKAFLVTQRTLGSGASTITG